MAGYWPCSFFESLWTLTPCWSINTQKKNSANIQPSWLHTWSITHTQSAVMMSGLLISKITACFWSIRKELESSVYNNSLYYMSLQDEPNPGLRLATQTGRMELSCPLGTTSCILQEKFPWKPYSKSFIDQACSVKMAGFWPRFFIASSWTSAPSRSINSQRKNLANIQPSWPHTWSILNPYLFAFKICLPHHGLSFGHSLMMHPPKKHPWSVLFFRQQLLKRAQLINWSSFWHRFV